MTKLTDLKGAKEALPKKETFLINKLGYPENIIKAHNDCVEKIESVHLEVDAEFLAKILSDCASENGFDYSTHGINVLSECIATNITKWARLVRK